MHVVIVRTPYEVGRSFRIGDGGGIGPTTRDAAPVFVTTYTVAVIEGCDDAWEFDGDVGTILVGVGVVATAMLPLVGAVQVNVEFLSASEEVAAGETDLRLGTVTATGTSDDVGLDIEVVGLLEYSVQEQVEGVWTQTWGELEIGRGEYTRGVDLVSRLEVVVITELLSRTESEVLQNDIRTDRGILTVETNGKVSTVDAIGELLSHILSELYSNITDVPFV